jgi:hypothetical protein
MTGWRVGMAATRPQAQTLRICIKTGHSAYPHSATRYTFNSNTDPAASVGFGVSTLLSKEQPLHVT